MYVVDAQRGNAVITTNDGYLFQMKNGTEFFIVKSNETTTTITIDGSWGHHFWTKTLRGNCKPIDVKGQTELNL